MLFKNDTQYQFVNEYSRDDFVDGSVEYNRPFAAFVGMNPFWVRETDGFSVSAIQIEGGPIVSAYDIGMGAPGHVTIISNSEGNYFKEVSMHVDVELYSVMVGDDDCGYFIYKKNISLEEAEEFAIKHVLDNHGTECVIFKGAKRFVIKYKPTVVSSDY